MVSSTNNSGANAGPGVALPAESTTVSIDPVTGFTYPQLPTAVVPTYNAATGQWMVNGTPVSVGGAAFQYMDSFTRADTTAPSLGPVNQASGDGAVRAFPANWTFTADGDGISGKITSNRYTSLSTQNCYAVQTLTGQKIRRLRAKIDWKGTISGGSPSTAVLIISPSTVGWRDHAVHLQVNPYYIELDKLIPTQQVIIVAGGNSAAGNFISPNYPYPVNTTVQIDAAYDDLGNYLITATNGVTLSGSDPYLATCLGPVLICQCYQQHANYTVEWSEVRAGFAALGT